MLAMISSDIKGDTAFSLVKSRGYWQGLWEGVENHVAQCERCSIAKDETLKPKVIMGK